MDSPEHVTVNAEELRDAFEVESSGTQYECSAYISLDTGRIYWQSDALDVDNTEDLPDDLDTSDRYIAVPHKNDLNLGRRLVLAFANQELPDDADTIENYFRRRGAYARFKDLLHARDALQRWYDFEARATEAALLAWCEANDIQRVNG